MEERGVLRGGLPDVAELLVALVGHGASRVVRVDRAEGKVLGGRVGVVAEEVEERGLADAAGGGEGGCEGVRVKGAQCAVWGGRVVEGRKGVARREGVSKRAKARVRE